MTSDFTWACVGEPTLTFATPLADDQDADDLVDVA
jgi:hypothetical protein